MGTLLQFEETLMQRLAAFLLLLAVACTGSDPTGRSGPSMLRVVTSSSGDPLDPDGYVVAVDCVTDRNGRRECASTVSVPATGSAMVTLLPTGGPHTVELAGLAFNCAVVGNSVEVVGAAEVDAEVEFSVRCSGVGHVRVTVATTGVDLDADGYYVSLTAGLVPAADVRIDLAANESTTIPVVAGTWSMNFQGVAFSCDQAGPARQDVIVRANETVEVGYEIHCRPASELLVVASSSEIFRVRGNDAAPVRIDHIGAWPTWSPDGTEIAFLSAEWPAATLYVVASNGSNLRRIAGHVIPGAVAWSPDGRDLLFASWRNSPSQIYRVGPDGTGLRRLIVSNTTDDSPSWSPDGRQIAFVRGGGLTIADADGSVLVMFWRQGQWGIAAPVWSPDGQRIAYVELDCTIADDCSGTIWVMRPDGTERRSLRASGTSPSWSPDGAWITYVGRQSIEAIRPDGSEHRLIRTGVPTPNYPAWRPSSSP